MIKKELFNPNDYDETYVMHCRSKEEAVVFGDYMKRLGYTLNNGQSFGVYWDRIDGGTCYRFKAGVRDSYNCYLDQSIWGFVPEILEFSDFCWDKDIKDNIELEFTFEQFMECMEVV